MVFLWFSMVFLWFSYGFPINYRTIPSSWLAKRLDLLGLAWAPGHQFDKRRRHQAVRRRRLVRHGRFAHHVVQKV